MYFLFRHGNALHANGPLSGKFTEKLHNIGVGEKYEDLTDKIRHQIHLHTNHYAQAKHGTHAAAEPVRTDQMSEMMVARKVVV